MKPIIIADEAIVELEESVDYLEHQRNGYGSRLQSALEAEIARIQRHPEWFGRVGSSDYRKLVMKRFSYNIYFREFDDYIWIVAISHQSRDQSYWMNRTPKPRPQ